jgi:ParB family chromosome partitioning protein
MTKTKKRAMGAGIDGLIPIMDGEDNSEGKTAAFAQPENLGHPFHVKITEIVKNPDQPRKNFKNEELTKMVNSIKDKGILEPLLVVKTELGYQLLAGHRRLMAAEIAKLPTVPVVIHERKGDVSENLEVALIENIVRQDLNPIEEAEAYEKLEKQYKKDTLGIARLVGKDTSTIKNSIRLLKLPDPVKQDIIESRLTAGHGKVLLALDGEPELMTTARSEVLSRQLTVRATELLVKKLLKAKKSKPNRDKEEQNAYYESLCRTFSDELNGIKVNIIHQGRDKKLILYYQNNDNLELILRKLNITVQS